MLSRFFTLLQGNGDDGMGGWIQWLLLLAVVAFQIWMLVDALRRGEYIWAVFMIIGFGISSVLYFFMVYRASGGGNPLAGFELPGAADRKRIKEIEASIHHLDKAHHHRQLADIYMAQGKLQRAEEGYRDSYERDPQDEDTRAHLGNCLARRDQWTEALPLLEGVCAQNPKHDYGYTLMSLAEAQQASGQPDRAVETWRKVLAMYTYSRARVQLAELLILRQENTEARRQIEEVITEAPFATKFQRKVDAIWLKRAKALLHTLPS